MVRFHRNCCAQVDDRVVCERGVDNFIWVTCGNWARSVVGRVISKEHVGKNTELTNDEAHNIEEGKMFRKEKDATTNSQKLLEDACNAERKRGGDVDQPVFANE